MTFELLISSLNAEPEKLAERMRIDSDAVMVNQCSENKETEFMYNSNTVKVISRNERGVGLSRNTALRASRADIILFSDEDIVYEKDYKKKVLEAFEKHKDADVITFNFKVDPKRRTYENTEIHRIKWNNYGRYPAYAIAAKRESIMANNISYSTLFGGGAKYSNGEDSLFLHDCLKRGLTMYAETDFLGEETYRESTWFKGYTDKFFFDRGVLYHFLYGPMAYVFGIRFLLKNRRTMLKEKSFFDAAKLLRAGISEGRKI